MRGRAWLFVAGAARPAHSGGDRRLGAMAGEEAQILGMEMAGSDDELQQQRRHGEPGAPSPPRPRHRSSHAAFCAHAPLYGRKHNVTL